jgi:dihydropteroate synthase
MSDPVAADRRAKLWELRSRTLHFGATPLVMGIVNVTPDSFSDGGRFLLHQQAVDHALQLVADGADILDIGGESTRPYAAPVDLQTELGRVLPVVEQLSANTDVPISIDTSKSPVAEAALAHGAEIINDVTALTGDPRMAEIALRCGAAVCAMHMQGTPQTMQDHPQYEDVVAEVMNYLAARLESLVQAGIPRSKICLDPGIGFGKTHQHNWTLVRQCWRFHALGQPILVGHSRKGFIGKAVDSSNIADRDLGTLVVSLELARQQIPIVRVHDVRATRQAFSVWRNLGPSEA